jgi:hypothetical protein
VPAALVADEFIIYMESTVMDGGMYARGLYVVYPILLLKRVGEEGVCLLCVLLLIRPFSFTSNLAPTSWSVPSLVSNLVLLHSLVRSTFP